MQTSPNNNTIQGIVLLFVPVLVMLGAVMIAPVLGVISQHYADVKYATVLVPLLLTAPALFLAFFSPVAGALVNRIGAKSLLLIVLALYGTMGVAPVFLDSLYLILASRIVLGIAEAGIVVAGMVLTSRYFFGEHRQKWIAYQNIALPLIGAAMLSIVGIVSVADWRNAFSLYGLSFIVFIAVLIFLYEPAQSAAGPQTQPSKKVSVPLPVIALFCAIAIPGSIAFYVVPVKLSFLLQSSGDFSPATVGKMLSFGLIFGAPAGAIAARLLKHWTFGKTLSLAMGIMSIGLFILAFSTGNLMSTIGVVIQQAGGGLMLTAALTYVLSVAPSEHTGTYSGAWWFIYTLANFSTPLVLSFTDTFTASHEATVTVVACLIILVAAWLFFTKKLGGRMSETPNK